jgi:hypothetical protein
MQTDTFSYIARRHRDRAQSRPGFGARHHPGRQVRVGFPNPPHTVCPYKTDTFLQRVLFVEGYSTRHEEVALHGAFSLAGSGRNLVTGTRAGAAVANGRRVFAERRALAGTRVDANGSCLIDK